MPGVEIKKSLLFEKIGKHLDDKEFDKLCFEFGIEMDDDLGDAYKIDIPANRYDLLCVEGLARALKVFLGLGPVPEYKTLPPTLTLNVEPSTNPIRPICVAAVLRNVTFDESSYNSFIALQEKLHHNVCRKRTLVAIGTHDLDTITGPFRYTALPPRDISFAPLNKEQVMNGEELMKFYEKDAHLKSFLPIIRDSPVYPVIYDSKGVVLSLPPIINGNHSKITVNTKNVFIECTATDATKASIVLNTIVCMFSEYCASPFTVEQVKIEYQDKSQVFPDLSGNFMQVQARRLSSMTGKVHDNKNVAQLLGRMCLKGEIVGQDGVNVWVPPTRSDILHECDLFEDLAIAYGYNKIERVAPPSATVGRPFPLNSLSDKVRRVVAQAGFIEALTFSLVSEKELFEFCRLPRECAVLISNPKSMDFQVVRTSLLLGLLKTLTSNIQSALPIRLFEVSDVVLLDATKEVGARNERRLAALYCSTVSGFEHIHGLLDYVMMSLAVTDYKLVKSSEPYLFPGRRADIIYRGSRVGSIGIVHPHVLNDFGLPHVASVLELNLEPFL